MKLIKLSDELLKFMVKSYHSTHKRVFTFPTFKELYPEFDDAFISDALYLLKDDGFVAVLSANNVAHTTTLLPSAIRNVEENTFIKRGYESLKEIRSWL